MSKKKGSAVIQDGEVQWNHDDVNLDSFGVEAPIKGECSDPTTRLDVSSSVRTPAH
jgi:hypothetical protein